MGCVIFVEGNLSVSAIYAGKAASFVILVRNAGSICGRGFGGPLLIVQFKADALFITGCELPELLAWSTIKFERVALGVLIAKPVAVRVGVAPIETGYVSVAILEFIVISDP